MSWLLTFVRESWCVRALNQLYLGDVFRNTLGTNSRIDIFAPVEFKDRRYINGLLGSDNQSKCKFRC